MARRALRIAALSIAALVLTEWPAAAQVKIAGGAAPEVGGGPWINSAALTTSVLRGRVALVEFWTFG